jgi:hypothetical protein
MKMTKPKTYEDTIGFLEYLENIYPEKSNYYWEAYLEELNTAGVETTKALGLHRDYNFYNDKAKFLGDINELVETGFGVHEDDYKEYLESKWAKKAIKVV